MSPVYSLPQANISNDVDEPEPDGLIRTPKLLLSCAPIPMWIGSMSTSIERSP
jgi:hypothetical protein